MPALDIKEYYQIGQALITLIGLVWAFKVGMLKLEGGQKRLEEGQAEGLRQMIALHKRMDYYGEELNKTKLELARVDERQKASDRGGLYRSQRFRLEGTE